MFHKLKLKVFVARFTPLHTLYTKALPGTTQNNTPFSHRASCWDKHRAKKGLEILPPLALTGSPALSLGKKGKRAGSYLTWGTNEVCLGPGAKAPETSFVCYPPSHVRGKNKGIRKSPWPLAPDHMVCKVSKNGFSEVTDPNKFFIVCKKSRIENNTSFYGCFYLGPFDESLSQTLANDLRRTLLSELVGLAITSVEIEGVLHKFSSLPGLKEPVLDFICNLQTVVLKQSGGPIKPQPPFTPKGGMPMLRLKADPLSRTTKKTYTGFLKVRGPRIIKARDLKLPAGILCVDPNQYIATLAEDGILNMKFQINQGKSYVFQKPQNLDVTNLKKRNILLHKTKKYKSLLNSNLVSSQTLELMKDQNNKTGFVSTQKDNSNTVLPKREFGENLPALSNVSFPLQPITLDAVFMPVTKVNCIIDDNNLATDFNIFKNLEASVPELMSMRQLSLWDKQKPQPGLSSQENQLKKGASSEDVGTNSLFTDLTPSGGGYPFGISESPWLTPKGLVVIPKGAGAKPLTQGDLGEVGSGELVKGTFYSFLPSPQRGVAHRGHFPTLDCITNADLQAQRQTSLFFNNAFCLYKNNLKLNKLYSQIKQQTKVKLLPWYENLAYFNFGNVEAMSTSTVPAAFYSFLVSSEKGLVKGAGAWGKSPIQTSLSPYGAKGLLPQPLTFSPHVKRRGAYSPSNIRLLSAKGKAFSFNKINKVKPLLGSYNFYNYNLSKIHHAKPLTVISHNAQAKQEFQLPIVAKKLLYPEKYSILPPVLSVPERGGFIRRDSLVGLSDPKASAGIKREPTLPLPSYTRIPLNYPLQDAAKAPSFYLDLSAPSKFPLHYVSSSFLPLAYPEGVSSYPQKGYAKAPETSFVCYPPSHVRGKNKGISKSPWPLTQSPLPMEGLGALSAVVTAKVHKKNSLTEYVVGENPSDKPKIIPALGDLAYLGRISNRDNVYSQRFSGKVYSYQDLLNIEYSKILKLKPLVKKCHLILEIWTNGSIHPRQALYNSFNYLTNTFLKLQKVKPLGTMFRSELAYGNINKYYTSTPFALLRPLSQRDKQSPSPKADNYGPGVKRGINVGNLEVGRGENSKQIVQKRGRESDELPIGVLPISLRAYTALRKAEIFTLKHLLNYSKGELLKLKNFGPKSLFEVEKTLADLGLSFGYPLSPPVIPKG